VYRFTLHTLHPRPKAPPKNKMLNSKYRNPNPNHDTLNPSFLRP